MPAIRPSLILERIGNLYLSDATAEAGDTQNQIVLHDRRNGDAHQRQYSDQLPPDHRGRGQQKFLPTLVGFREDMVPVIKIIEQLRELESMFGSVGRLGGSDALVH